uniref:Uncharacterized protein n=1 Tax=Knipowitschia caucasica TaxID=637954 RepID=A0AAV2KV38_KNICA
MLLITHSSTLKLPLVTSAAVGGTSRSGRTPFGPNSACGVRREKESDHGLWSPCPPPRPLIRVGSMISHYYPLTTLLPWSMGPQSHHHCPGLDCPLLLEGEGGVALQRYQARSPESSPRHWYFVRASKSMDPLSTALLTRINY